jgi:hypothetical protein
VYFFPNKLYYDFHYKKKKKNQAGRIQTLMIRAEPSKVIKKPHWHVKENTRTSII